MNDFSFTKNIEVNAYSGYKANERPISFILDDRKLKVVKIIDRWYGVDYDYFKVLANDGKLYLLRWHRTLDEWSLQKIAVSGNIINDPVL